MRCYTNRKLNDLDWNSVLYSLPTKNYYYSIYLTLLVKLEIERKEAAEQKRTPMNSEQWRYIHLLWSWISLTVHTKTSFVILFWIVLIYKNTLIWTEGKIVLQIPGRRLRIWKHFEITSTIYTNSQTVFETEYFFTCYTGCFSDLIH